MSIRARLLAYVASIFTFFAAPFATAQMPVNALTDTASETCMESPGCDTGKSGKSTTRYTHSDLF